MSDEDVGEKVIDAIIKGKLIAKILDSDGKVLDNLTIVWSDNAYEQLGKLVRDLRSGVQSNNGSPT